MTEDNSDTPAGQEDDDGKVINMAARRIVMGHLSKDEQEAANGDDASAEVYNDSILDSIVKLQELYPAQDLGDRNALRLEAGLFAVSSFIGYASADAEAYMMEMLAGNSRNFRSDEAFRDATAIQYDCLGLIKDIFSALDGAKEGDKRFLEKRLADIVGNSPAWDVEEFSPKAVDTALQAHSVLAAKSALHHQHMKPSGYVAELQRLSREQVFGAGPEDMPPIVVAAWQRWRKEHPEANPPDDPNPGLRLVK